MDLVESIRKSLGAQRDGANFVSNASNTVIAARIWINTVPAARRSQSLRNGDRIALPPDSKRARYVARAEVAQLVEQLIRNQQVTGSSPVFGSLTSARPTALSNPSASQQPTPRQRHWRLLPQWVSEGVAPKGAQRHHVALLQSAFEGDARG